MEISIVIAGPWGTFASLFFFLAALLGGDLLALRGCLLLAYVCLLVNGATGIPGWVSAAVHGRVAVDMMVWAVAAGVLHGCAVVRMLMDELPVRWSSTDDEQLARFFNRRSGMEPLEAKEVLKRGRWLRVPAGQRVVSSIELYEHVYLLVEGCCSFLNPCCHSSPASPVKGFSAQSAATYGALQGLDSAALSGQLQHQQQGVHLQHQQSNAGMGTPLQHMLQQQAGRLGEFSLTRSMSLSDDLAGVTAATDELSFSNTLVDMQPVSINQAQPAAATADSHSKTAISVSFPPATGATAQGSFSAKRQHPHAYTLEAVHPSASVQAESAAASAERIQDVLINKLQQQQRLLRSGNIFSLSALNMFGVYIGFDQFHGSQFEVWAESDALLYSWPMSALEEMAMNCSPSLAAYWRNFITYSLASEFELQAHKRMALCRCSTGEYEVEGWAVGGRSRDFTDHPRAYEGPQPWTWQRCKRWLLRAISPFPPHGIRHTALPITGVMARTRAMAVAEAGAQAAHSRDVSLRLGVAGGGNGACITVQ